MNWIDWVPNVLSIVAIIVSCWTALTIVSPHSYIHAICKAEAKYILLLIINNGFSTGLLFTNYGIVYYKKGRRYFVSAKGTEFKPSKQLCKKDMEMFWSGNFLKPITPQESIFLVLDNQDVYSKLKGLEEQGIKSIRFYLYTSTPWGNKQIKRIQSKPQKIKELLKNYENHPH